MVNYWYILIVAPGAAVWGFVMMCSAPTGAALVRQGEADRPAVQEAVPRAVHQPLAAHDGPADQRRRADARHDRITADISGNTLYKRMWRAVYSAVKQGKKISAPLKKSPCCPARSCR
jgi:hypothetical protein